MDGEKEISTLIKTMNPWLHEGNYVFCTVDDLSAIQLDEIILTFREEEGTTLVIRKELADHLKLEYASSMAWITLTVHSSLEAVGLTAAFSSALAKEGISCNVVAGYYHDHLFTDSRDAEKAMEVLRSLSE